ncbi:MAG: acyl-CoA/acyl-ACP dehydrogenase [Deltaproteobacteria bacterium]|jgi:acyl-CoA dehydrogenase|nr:acyl-CoA/acyl-ACP dehydrogenase [Deltaproteobacteria bacterium]
MDFELTAVQQEIVHGVRQLCKRFPDAYWREHDAAHEFPHAFYHAVAEAGYLGVAIPGQYGGSGLGIAEAALLMREVAYAGAMNAASSIHLSIFGLTPVVLHGAEEMKRKYLPEVVSGKLHAAFAVTEPDAGNDITHIKTFARRDGDYYVINGRKIFTTKAQVARKMLLLARTIPLENTARKTDGLSLFFADLDRAAVEVRELEKLGRHAVDTNILFIDNLRVPATDLVGEEGRGFRYLLDGLNPERILVAAEAVGIGRAAVDRAVRYAKERVVFGRPIGQNQAIAHPLAEAYAKLEVADLITIKAAWLFDQRKPCGAEAAVAKLLAAEAAFQACDRAVQTLGGYGYMREYDVERYFRECRMLKIAPLSQEMALNMISEHVLRLPRSY